MYGLSAGTKNMAVTERLSLVEVQQFTVCTCITQGHIQELNCSLMYVYHLFQAIQTTMHQGAADNITHLEAKTQYGRPAWNKIFKDIADKHKGWVGLYG